MSPNLAEVGLLRCPPRGQDVVLHLFTLAIIPMTFCIGIAGMFTTALAIEIAGMLTTARFIRMAGACTINALMEANLMASMSGISMKILPLWTTRPVTIGKLICVWAMACKLIGTMRVFRMRLVLLLL